MHTHPNGRSALGEILDRAGSLPAAPAIDREPIENGRVYTAIPDRHLLIEPGRVRVVFGPRENRFRPAVDPLFRSAALAYGPRVIGVVLTGSLDDGAAGLAEIKRRGGLAVVQDPEEAQCPGMPRSAMSAVQVDGCAPIAELGPMLARLARTPAGPWPEETRVASADIEVDFARMHPPVKEEENMGGTLAGFTCPECDGNLWEQRSANLLKFRCRVGHAFSEYSLLQAQSEALEHALWVALRALEESGAAARRLSKEARRRNSSLAQDYEKRAMEREEHAGVIRRLLVNLPGSQSGEADRDAEQAPLA
jgi:two-component system chemotaxis response regulator CheB